MQIAVQLVRKGWKSVSRDGVTVFVRGQAHLGDEYLDTQALAECFLAVALQLSNPPNLQSSKLPAIVSSLNGNWAVVVHTSSSAFLAVDHIRSIQLLYSQEGGNFFVFDDVEEFRKTYTVEFLEGSVQEYLSSGFVYGNATLFKDVFSLQAGECVAVDAAGTVESKRYYRFHALPSEKPLPTDLDKRADEVFLRTFRRTLQVVGEKRIAVPLSGGCDSRLIVNYLHRLGVKNVVTFSYGFPNNREAVIAKQVAAGLGYPWHFVEYDKGLREREIYDFNVAPHNRFMCNGVNRPCKQDFHAIKELLARGIIHEGDVIMPGYAFDLLAGSQLDSGITDSNAISVLQSRDANQWPSGRYLQVRRRLKALYKENNVVLVQNFVEMFCWAERCGKFTNNNVRTYEAFGLNWHLPMWDRELMDFWARIPKDMRMDRGYFYSLLPKLCAESIKEVPYFNIHAHGNKLPLRKVFSNKIRSLIPNGIKYLLREIRFSLGLHAPQVKDSNPQSGQVNVRPEVRSRLIEAFPMFGIERRLLRNQDKNRGAIETMVSLLQMTEV